MKLFTLTLEKNENSFLATSQLRKTIFQTAHFIEMESVRREEQSGVCNEGSFKSAAALYTLITYNVRLDRTPKAPWSPSVAHSPVTERPHSQF